MAAVVRMPSSLAGVTEAAVQAWLATTGQPVALGDPLVEIETEKAVFECEAETAGTIGALLVEPGVSIAVGEPIAVILEEGEGTDVLDAVLAASGVAPALAAPSGRPAPMPDAPDADPPRVESSRRIFASPLVRKLARERGIALESLVGSGPGGRVVRRDLDRLGTGTATAGAASVDASSASPPPPPAATSARWTDAPVTGMRRAIARRLTESATTVPHFTMSAHLRVDALLALRRDINAVASRAVSVNDLIVKAVAGALEAVPAANAVWNGETIRSFAGVDIAIAVAVEGGLVTPVLQGVEQMPLATLAAAAADLAERARAGRLKPHELEGGTFTVSNLGMLGVDEFTAIINPPHAGILAVGAAKRRPVVVDDDIVAATVMTVTLSADHRVLDGAVAAEWMTELRARIEQPMRLLVASNPSDLIQ